jgi:hypothetical protein
MASLQSLRDDEPAEDAALFSNYIAQFASVASRAEEMSIKHVQKEVLGELKPYFAKWVLFALLFAVLRCSQAMGPTDCSGRASRLGPFTGIVRPLDAVYDPPGRPQGSLANAPAPGLLPQDRINLRRTPIRPGRDRQNLLGNGRAAAT